MTGTQPRKDPTGDERANLIARLDNDLMTWSSRRDITFGQDAESAPTEVLARTKEST